MSTDEGRKGRLCAYYTDDGPTRREGLATRESPKLRTSATRESPKLRTSATAQNGAKPLYYYTKSPYYYTNPRYYYTHESAVLLHKGGKNAI